MSSKPVQPVAPDGMEFLFFYACPFCSRHVSMVSPTQPTMAQCSSCQKNFPIMPVDEHGLDYIRIILANGKAAIDPDFV